MSQSIFLLACVCCSRLAAADLTLPSAIKNVFTISGGLARLLGVDPAGNMYAGGDLAGNGLPVPSKTVIGTAGSAAFFVAKIAPQGDQFLYLVEVRVSSSIYTNLKGAAIEADGSIVLAGGTRSPDFPTTDQSYQPHSAKGGAFLMKLDSSGNLVFSTLLDDNSETLAHAVVRGPNGNYYVAGETDGTTFPTTPGAFETKSSKTNVGFVTEFSPDGQRLLLSTLVNAPAFGMSVDSAGAIHVLEAGQLDVLNPSGSQLISSRTTSVNPIVNPSLLDSAGNLFALENAGTPDSFYRQMAVINKFDPAGKLLFTAKLPGFFGFGFTVLDDGTVVLGGDAVATFPTRNTLQPCSLNLPHEAVPLQWWLLGQAAVIVLDPDGSVRHATFLGGPAPPGYGGEENIIEQVIKDANGNIYFGGSSASPSFPGGTALVPGPTSLKSFGMKFDLASLPKSDRLSPACLTLSKPGQPFEAPVVPAMFMSLFGSSLGPAVGVQAQLNADQQLPFELAGTKITVGGLPAPLLSVQDSQIDFVVPQAVQGPTTDVCVERDTEQACLFAYVGTDDGAVGLTLVNQDGSVNSPENRAPAGSVISVYGVGFGVFDPSTPDGALAQSAFSSSHPAMQAQFSQQSRLTPFVERDGEVVYLGSAPQLLNGVLQMNITVPSGLLPSLPATLTLSRTGARGIPAYPLALQQLTVYIQ